MENAYTESLNFWDQAFGSDEYKQYINELDPDDGWKDLASSEKLMDVLVEQLVNKKNVLDYGCGEGWAGITLNKSGCKNVTCVDVVENAIKLANSLKEKIGIETGFQAACVSDEWLDGVQSNTFDGIFCSNVLDVLPENIANKIIKNFSKIATADAKIVISMNYYVEPVSNPEKNIEIKNGNELYVNGILRMVTRTDEEWTNIFSKCFEVDKIEYFAWPGEDVEKRRIFIMRRK